MSLYIDKTPDDTPVVETWNQTAEVGRNTTVVFVVKNADVFVFWKGNDNLIQTGPGSRYDNPMNGKLGIVNVSESDEGWIKMRAVNSTSGKTAIAFMYLHVHRSKNYTPQCTYVCM